MRKVIAMVLGSGALLLSYVGVGSGADIVGTVVNLAGAPIAGVPVSVQNKARRCGGSRCQ